MVHHAAGSEGSEDDSATQHATHMTGVGVQRFSEIDAAHFMFQGSVARLCATVRDGLVAR